jgi:hypothetical protein
MPPVCTERLVLDEFAREFEREAQLYSLIEK